MIIFDFVGVLVPVSVQNGPEIVVNSHNVCDGPPRLADEDGPGPPRALGWPALANRDRQSRRALAPASFRA
jgi:hypothetical protein